MDSASVIQSLFVLSLPRSFSTQVYEYAGRALSLRAPSWVLDGEILNVDHYTHYRGTAFDECAKFTLPERNPALAGQLHEYLDQTANPQGWIYKDVIQPFVLQRWQGLGQFRILKIRRDLCDIAYAMLKQGWFYPQKAALSPKTTPLMLSAASRMVPFEFQDRLHHIFHARFRTTVLEGLLRAESALDALDGVVVPFRELMQDEDVLYDALGTLYPDVPLVRTHYIDAAFAAKRERIARRETTSEYKKLSQELSRLREQLAVEKPIGLENNNT